jgi:hypothetical protein
MVPVNVPVFGSSLIDVHPLKILLMIINLALCTHIIVTLKNVYREIIHFIRGFYHFPGENPGW